MTNHTRSAPRPPDRDGRRRRRLRPFALGGAVGGGVYDLTGGYGAFFVGAAATCVAAGVLSLGIGRTPRAPIAGRTDRQLGEAPAVA